MDASLQDAEKNFGDMETRDAHMTKAEYLTQIGSKVSKFVQTRTSIAPLAAIAMAISNIIYSFVVF